MSYLLLHNGNQLIKPWAKKFYNCDTMPCLTDTWHGITDLDLKYAVARSKTVCTDLTTADTFNVVELYQAKSTFTILKIITSYENDCNNIEPVWSKSFDQTQWLVSIFNRLSVADRVLFQQPVALSCLNNEPKIIFSPGRSGTHVLRDITKTYNYTHHNESDMSKSEILRIVNAESILGIMRKQFVDQVVSDAISKKYGVMLSRLENINANREIVSKWEPFEINDMDYISTFEKMSSYADWLLGFKMFYNKQIEFSLLEELQEHFEKCSYMKNPYLSKKVISNYDQVVEICSQQYQPFYNQLIAKLQCMFGTSLYNYDKSF